jgi:hypothetical protein
LHQFQEQSEAMQRNPHSYQIATGYRTFYSLSLIYQPITKKRLFFYKKYLIKNGVNEKSKYNQIANYTYLDTQVNKAVRDDSPNIYFSKVFEQCETGIAVYGNITDKALLLKNLQQNCIPETILQMEHTNYEEFLAERRKLMAKKIKKYYYSL